MANQLHLDLMKQGVEIWNRWRKEHSDIRPDLSEVDLAGVDLNKADLTFANLNEADLTLADLSGANLTGASLFMTTLVNANLYNVFFTLADLTSADLTASHLAKADLSNANLTAAILASTELVEANLTSANLIRADLSKANLSRADLSNADLSRANLNRTNLANANLNGAILSKSTLRKADLSNTNLIKADLSETDLTGANLASANLTKASLVETNLERAIMTGCIVYGISSWNIQVREAKQDGLVITPPDEPKITVDNLDVAQFIYLLLDNQRFRDVLDAIVSKVVLILGRFTPERKVVLDELREELRKHDYLPMLFDFEKPHNRDVVETISTLAHLSRFIIADLTDPSSIPQELQHIVPSLLVPIQPILQEGKREYSMFSYFSKYHWVLPIYLYSDLTELLVSLKERVIEPAERKVRELQMKKYW